MQLRCKSKISKEIYKMFPWDSQMLRKKRHFVISMIALNVFYCIFNSDIFLNISQIFKE